MISPPSTHSTSTVASVRLRLDVAERFPPAVLAAFAQLVRGGAVGGGCSLERFRWGSPGAAGT